MRLICQNRFYHCDLTKAACFEPFFLLKNLRAVLTSFLSTINPFSRQGEPIEGTA